MGHPWALFPIPQALLLCWSHQEKPFRAFLQDAPKQSSSSSSRQRALFVLLGPGVASAWLDEWLRPGPEVCGGGGRIGMPEDGGAGARAGANTEDELLGVSNSARSMRVSWFLEWFPGWANGRGQE